MSEPLYVSLVGPLIGCYLRVVDAPSVMALRLAMNNSRLVRCWCSVYSEDDFGKASAHDWTPTVVIQTRISSLVEDWDKYQSECDALRIEPEVY